MMAKVFGIALVTYLLKRITTAPHELSKSKGDLKVEEKISKAHLYFGNALVNLILALFSSTYIYCLYQPTDVIFGVPVTVTARWSSIELLGLTLMCSGSALRLWAYDTLGRFFTYEIGIRKRHSLITWGPYSVVRHPSYSGFLLSIPGVYFFPVRAILRPFCQHFLKLEADFMVFTFGVLVSYFLTTSRITAEERMLELHFGDEWTKYAHRTKKLIPYIY
jgi:protein-S-isoprenylcysteine O-methyltransferase Ste14